MDFIYRVIGGFVGTVYERIFYNAQEGSVYADLFKEHTDSESFIGFDKGTKLLMSSDEKLTIFHNPFIVSSVLSPRQSFRAL